MEAERVVITGMGVTSGIGNDLRSFSQALTGMRSGIRAVDTFDTSQYEFHLGSTVHGLEKRLTAELRHQPRPIQFLMNAAQDALLQSGIRAEPHRIGCSIAGPACSIFEVESYYRDVARGERTRARDLAHANWDAAVNQLGYRFDLLGPRNTILTACSSSGVALGLALDLIRLGEADAMVAGGTDGFSEFTYSGFQSLQSISAQPCRPFDRARDGLSFGEGAGILILEKFAHARARGAEILGEIVSYGACGEGVSLTAPSSDGYGYLKTMSRALELGGVDFRELGYVNAHGTATPLNDAAEGAAIHRLFNERGANVPVNSIKSLVGHCMGAAGAVEAVSCVLSLREGFIPGTLHCDDPDPEIGVNVVRQTVRRRIDSVLCNSAGFGGNNSSVLFRRFGG